MGFLKQYMALTKDVHETRAAYFAAENKVTAFHPVLNLDSGFISSVTPCFNAYERVVGSGVSEDTPFCLQCELLNHETGCENRKCERFADNQEYLAARERYAKALAMRREFVKSALHFRKK